MDKYLEIISFFNDKKYDDEFINNFVSKIKEKYIQSQIEKQKSIYIQDYINKRGKTCPKCDRREDACYCIN